ncbi:MAG: hypothetical protein KJ066_00665 [Acidobacteria bacterium]|nr:hypothetical protein [Acidobacteriota bacterium]
MGPVDWQSVVVTVVAFAAALVIVRPFLPSRRASRPGRPGCPSCAAGHAACAKTPPQAGDAGSRPVPLTLVGRERGPGVED